jgi:hypothetical protein
LPLSLLTCIQSSITQLSDLEEKSPIGTVTPWLRCGVGIDPREKQLQIPREYQSCLCDGNKGKPKKGLVVQQARVAQQTPNRKNKIASIPNKEKKENLEKEEKIGR